MLENPPPPSISNLERLVLDNVPLDLTITFDEQVARVRAYVRSEVEKALRESAGGVSFRRPRRRPG